MQKPEEQIIAILKAKADMKWSESKEPFLLSQAVPALKERQVDYRAILGEEKLKTFVTRTGPEGGYRLVSHPIQKPKIGIVPLNEHFEFEEHEADEGAEKLQKRRTDLRQTESNPRAFIKALSRLSDDELDQIAIPTRIFVKLLGGR